MRSYAIVAAALLAAPQVQAQEVERMGGGDVAIYNLAGEARVVQGSGSEVVVRIQRDGADASQLRIETGEIRGRETLRIIYPDEDITYRGLGRSSSNVSVRADGTFGDGGRRNRGDRISISGRAGGLEAWADLVIEVPAGARVATYVAVGEIDARDVEADLVLDIGSGQITARNIRGELEVDTGSGSVEIEGVQGSLTADTGSGRIDVSDVVGDVVELDTGSGGITALRVEAGSLEVDTGSGSIELGEIASRDVIVDTGSGSVELELLTDVDRLEVDTGSGSVTIRAPADLGGRVEIDTGSGGIDLDFPLEVRSVRRDHVEGTIGDGRGSIEIDTGSGSVRLLRTGGMLRLR